MEHFEPTSTHPRWRGKIKCLYCKATGWPKDSPWIGHWSDRHGAHCKKRP